MDVYELPDLPYLSLKHYEELTETHARRLLNLMRKTDLSRAAVEKSKQEAYPPPITQAPVPRPPASVKPTKTVTKQPLTNSINPISPTYTKPTIISGKRKQPENNLQCAGMGLFFDTSTTTNNSSREENIKTNAAPISSRNTKRIRTQKIPVATEERKATYYRNRAFEPAPLLHSDTNMLTNGGGSSKRRLSLFSVVDFDGAYSTCMRSTSPAAEEPALFSMNNKKNSATRTDHVQIPPPPPFSYFFHQEHDEEVNSIDTDDSSSTCSSISSMGWGDIKDQGLYQHELHQECDDHELNQFVYEIDSSTAKASSPDWF